MIKGEDGFQTENEMPSWERVSRCSLKGGFINVCTKCGGYSTNVGPEEKRAVTEKNFDSAGDTMSFLS